MPSEDKKLNQPPQSEEPIEPFVGPPAIERVLDISNTQIFRTKPQLIYTHDRSHCEHCNDTLLYVMNPVPVYSSCEIVPDSRLGFANLSFEDDDKIIAEMFLTRLCPERLDIENGEHVYAELEFEGDIYFNCPHKMVANRIVLSLRTTGHSLPLQPLDQE